MQLWTYEHFITLIPSLILMFGIAYFLKYLTNGKNKSVRMIPFQILAIFLVISEIIKQVVSIKRGYTLYHIPLHVCSLFIYLIPAMAFYKGKYLKFIGSLTSSVCCALCVLMFISPTWIYTSDNINNFFNDYLDFHTVFFHELVMFEFILILVLRLNNDSMDKKYTKELTLFGIGYVLIAAPMAQILKTNFSNFYRCNIGIVQDFIETIKMEIGYVLAQSIYVVILGILHVTFFIFSYFVYRMLERKLNSSK